MIGPQDNGFPGLDVALDGPGCTGRRGDDDVIIAIDADHCGVYRKLVDRANDWLDKNRDVQVKTCQTMTWMSHDSSRLGSGEFMISSKNFTENAVTYYLRGLR